LPLQTRALSSTDFFRKVPADIAADIHTVIQLLKSVYRAKSYIVGGAVRDYLLGRCSMDFDIECYDITREDFEKAMGELGAEGVGRSFFVYKYHHLDIALPRFEKKVAKGHRGFEVSLATDAREASKRRDFTVNALMYDPERGEILDHWGGLQDLDDRLLRAVDRNSFVEDSLRVLRAMQFTARFGFRVEEESCRLCRTISLDDLPKERIFSEFEKMFRSDYPHYGLYYLFALGIARQLFGIDVERISFVKLAKELATKRESFLESLLPYYFPYIFSSSLGIDANEMLEKIGAPGVYFKTIANVPRLPETIDCAFVAGVAKKEGIESYVGNYHPRVRALAERLDIWEHPFDGGVTPTALMAEGYEGKALGEELERRRVERIGGLNEDCTES